MTADPAGSRPGGGAEGSAPVPELSHTTPPDGPALVVGVEVGRRVNPAAAALHLHSPMSASRSGKPAYTRL